MGYIELKHGTDKDYAPYRTNDIYELDEDIVILTDDARVIDENKETYFFAPGVDAENIKVKVGDINQFLLFWSVKEGVEVRLVSFGTGRKTTKVVGFLMTEFHHHSIYACVFSALLHRESKMNFRSNKLATGIMCKLLHRCLKSFKLKHPSLGRIYLDIVSDNGVIKYVNQHCNFSGLYYRFNPGFKPELR